MKAVLFDLDGVIADTAVYHFAAWRALVKKHFQADLPDSLEEKTKGVSREDSLRVILTHLHYQCTEEQFQSLSEEKNHLYQNMLEQVSKNDILPTIEQLILAFRHRGIKIALASASQNGPLILEKLGLLEQFDAIVDPHTVSAGKPAPDIFLAAAKALDVDITDCVGIEDSIAGVLAIRSAGAVCIGIGGEELSQAHYRCLDTSELSALLVEKVWDSYRTLS